MITFAQNKYIHFLMHKRFCQVNCSDENIIVFPNYLKLLSSYSSNCVAKVSHCGLGVSDLESCSWCIFKIYVSNLQIWFQPPEFWIHCNPLLKVVDAKRLCKKEDDGLDEEEEVSVTHKAWSYLLTSIPRFRQERRLWRRLKLSWTPREDSWQNTASTQGGENE